jgi:plasmid stabilization system protein ParE
MIRDVILLPEARQDVRAAYDWYESQSSGLGNEFIDSVDACLSRIRRNPEINSIIYKTFRRALTRRFPFAVFYEINGGDLVIYAVFHCARDPLKWERRLGTA